MNITELGASESSINDIADSVLIMDGGYKTLDKNEIRKILKKESLTIKTGAKKTSRTKYSCGFLVNKIENQILILIFFFSKI